MKRSIVYTAIAFGILLQGLPEPVLAQQIPSAETNMGPTAAQADGVTYVAWKGKKTGADIIYYTNASGSQAGIGFAKTTQAPALTAQGDTLFLAWRGQGSGSTDNIYFSSYATMVASPAWSAQQEISR